MVGDSPTGNQPAATRQGAPLWVVAAYSPPDYTQIWLETGIGADPAQEGKLAEVRARCW